MTRPTKVFRILFAATGAPVPGQPDFRTFSAAHKEAGHLGGKLPSPTVAGLAATLNVGTFYVSR
jgi:hypothetical protein